VTVEPSLRDGSGAIPARADASIFPESWLPLLSAKLAPPKVPAHAIPRPRITGRLAEPWRLAVVTGGPGTGKTVMASQWFETLAADRRAWVSLDPADDRPTQFWPTVVTALEGAATGSFARTTALAASGRSDEDLFLVELAAEAAALEPPVALVLEDLHTVRDRRVQDGLAFLVDHLTDGLQIMITSRVDPRLPIGRWRTRPWFVEIRQADLNFTPAEAETLFAAMGEHRIERVDVEHLTKHTEGWAAALQLAALAMRSRDDPSAVARRLTGRHYMVADLLLSEVVERQADDVREFMLTMSVADHFDAELCEALTGRSDSAEVLRSLEAQMLFLLSVDDEHSTFRFHHLLAELLLGELTRRDPDRVSRLHRDAAAVFEGRGDILEAIRHLVAAGRHDQAFALAFGSAVARWDHGDISAAAAWIDLFPSDYIEETVPRMLTFALALGICARLDEAIGWIDRAVVRLRIDEHPREQDVAMADALQLLLVSCHDILEEGVDYGQLAVEAVDRGLDLGTAGTRARSNLARAYLLDDRPEDARRVLSAGTNGDELVTVLLAPAVAARVAWREGNLTEASESASRALNGAAALGVPQHVGTLDALLARAGTLTDRNELAEAARVVDYMRDLAAHYGLEAYLVLVRLDEVRGFTARDDLDAARLVIDEMRATAGTRSHPRLQRLVDAVEARWFIDAGEASRAAAIVGRLPESRPARALLEARLSLASGQPQLVFRNLDRPFGTLRDQLGAELLRLHAAQLQDSPELTGHVDRAVALASAERLALIVLEEGRTVSRLVRAAAESSESSAAQQFAIALGAAPVARRTAPPHVVLTDRELAVLRYLPSRLTNQEIAAELFMSVNTVKTHLKNLYAKIGASSRSDAVRRARALDVL
jgi:LuxR family transcriptional regulator, maltose regulon positive regulatory protein